MLFSEDQDDEVQEETTKIKGNTRLNAANQKTTCVETDLKQLNKSKVLYPNNVTDIHTINYNSKIYVCIIVSKIFIIP